MAKMNGLDNITRKITEDALADAEKYRAEARAEAEKVLAKARAEGAAQGEKIIEKARAEAKNIAQRTESQANMEVRSAVLSARRRAMSYRPCAPTLGSDAVDTMYPASFRRMPCSM